MLRSVSHWENFLPLPVPDTHQELNVDLSNITEVLSHWSPEQVYSLDVLSSTPFPVAVQIILDLSFAVLKAMAIRTRRGGESHQKGHKRQYKG